MTAYRATPWHRATLTGLRSGRETPKRLLAIADDGVRLHIVNDGGTSLASIALDDDQTLLLGLWLQAVADGGDPAEPTLTTVLESGRFSAERNA